MLMGMTLLALTLSQPAPAQPLPVPLTVGNSVVLLKAQATGVQIDACKANPAVGNVPRTYAWVFQAPEADLSGSDGGKLGRHYAGPTWEAADGSKVVGSLLASASSPGNVPWLLLAAKSTTGKGLFSNITYGECVFTSGGTAPRSGAAATHAGTQVRVPYTTAYIFYGHR